MDIAERDGSLEDRVAAISSATFGPGDVVALRHLTTGWESEVWSFDFVPQSGIEPLRLVARLYAGPGAAGKGRTETVVMPFARNAGLAVPEVFGFVDDGNSSDRPLMVMERVEGAVLGDRMHQASESERDAWLAEFAKLAARLHQIDISGAMPAGIRELTMTAWLAEGAAAIEQFGMDEFRPVLDWLLANAPASERACLTHNDLHPWNVIVKPEGEMVVIDWTNATLGDPRFDLAWTLLLIDSHLEREARGVALEAYESATEPVTDLPYFEAVAAARRLFDIAVSLRHGPEALGMQAAAANEMTRSRSTIDVPLRKLEFITGIQIHLEWISARE